MRNQSVRRLIGVAALSGSLLVLGAPAQAIEVPSLSAGSGTTEALSADNKPKQHDAGKHVNVSWSYDNSHTSGLLNRNNIVIQLPICGNSIQIPVIPILSSNPQSSGCQMSQQADIDS